MMMMMMMKLGRLVQFSSCAVNKPRVRIDSPETSSSCCGFQFTVDSVRSPPAPRLPGLFGRPIVIDAILL